MLAIYIYAIVLTIPFIAALILVTASQTYAGVALVLTTAAIFYYLFKRRPVLLGKIALASLCITAWLLALGCALTAYHEAPGMLLLAVPLAIAGYQAFKRLRETGT